MFKVSQEIYLNSSDSANHTNTYGTYHKISDDDNDRQRKIFISPDLTDVKKVRILHFPTTASVSLNQLCEFVIKMNNAKGNIEVKLCRPTGKISELPLSILDTDRYAVRLVPDQCGIHRITIKLNNVELPQSPLKLLVDSAEATQKSPVVLPIFNSDASKVKHDGLGLKHILVNKNNEFMVDASLAGNNIFFVGICGPNGQCDEVTVKHIGHNLYNISYRIYHPGQYIISAKWGNDHIPGSPFLLCTLP